MNIACVPRRVWSFCQKNKAHILSFLIPAVLLFASYMFFGVYPAGKRSVLALDLNAQYVYYYDYMYDVFAGKESLFYSWSRTLSGEFFGIFAYYLASPFSFIVWLFPRSAITEGLLTMILVKAAVTGFTMSVFLKKARFHSDTATILFSIMYALSGYFSAHSINPMWLDGMIALPLVIMGVERVCDKKRFLLYTLSLVYVFVANYYIGYMVGIFSALYFVYYIAAGKTCAPSAAGVGKSVLVYGSASVSAILMSCFVLLPAYKSLQMGKLAFGTPDYKPTENFNISDILIKLFPGTFDTIRPEGFPMIYCGTLALIFALVYFVMRKIPLRQRIAGGALLGIIILSMYIKPADMFWHGGKVPVWMPYRYAFVAVFLLVMFGAEAFENIKQVKRKTIGSVFGILTAVLLICDHYEGSDHFNTTLIIVMPLIILSVITGAVLFYRRYSEFFSMKLTLLILLCVELIINNLVTFVKMNKDIYYSTRESYLEDIPNTRAVADEVKALDDGFFRMEKTYHRCVNDPLATGLYGMSHSTSTFNANAISLVKKLGFGAREHYSRYDGATPLTDDIFGIKYVFSKSEILSQYDEVLDIPADGDIKVYKNEDALGLAYLADLNVIGLKIDDISPFSAQEHLAARLAGEEYSIFVPVTDYYIDLNNLNAGSTTDAHSSYKKRIASEDASIVYNITAHYDGKVYMYLPTNYERECKLYVNDEFIKYYFKNENHSIAYLGEHKKGETFRLKLELVENEVYFTSPLFFSLDENALSLFNGKMQSMNESTVVTRTDKAQLSIETKCDTPRALFTSIPYEEGWTAAIDGEPLSILTTANDTLMCFKIPSGNHTIELSFYPAGMKTGIVLSLAGFAVFAAMIAVSVLIKRKNKTRILSEIEDISDSEDVSEN